MIFFRQCTVKKTIWDIEKYLMLLKTILILVSLLENNCFSSIVTSYNFWNYKILYFYWNDYIKIILWKFKKP